MTLERMEQILYMRAELQTLTRRLQACYNAANQYVGDSVKDYSSGRGRTKIIRGYTVLDINKADLISQRIKKRKAALESEIFEAEIFIDTIADSKIRGILAMRFIEGLEWHEVAGYYHKMTADSCRMAVKRFFGDVA